MKYQKTVIIATIGIISFFIPKSIVYGSLDSITDGYQQYQQTQLLQNIQNNLNELQRSEAMKRQRATYGDVAYNACADTCSTYIADYRKTLDMSFPENAQRVTSASDYCFSDCLIRYQNSVCPKGYIRVKSGSQCVTFDAGCKEIYGQNSVYTKYDALTGNLSCITCPQGFAYDSALSKCVHLTLCNGKYWKDCSDGDMFYCPPTGDPQCQPNQPIKTNNQICQDSYGLNSYWDGTKDSNGNLNCGCNAGYGWNITRTVCVINTANVNSTSTVVSYAGIPVGFQFASNLKQGATSNDVKYLQILLNSDSATAIGNAGKETNYFGSATQAAVVKFQNKYASEVLVPYGISISTGFFGSASRAKANAMLQNK